MNRLVPARTWQLAMGAAFVALALALARPAPAVAAWPLESGGTITLAFGATYRSAETTTASVHHGVDIAAAPGERVRAPVGGKVTFCGRVPAAGGGTCLAVTLVGTSGSLTLMPLSSSLVRKGDAVDEAAVLGELGRSGDGSSPEPHLHVGLRRGDLYVDPTPLLGSPAAAPSAPGAPCAGGTPSHASGATAHVGSSTTSGHAHSPAAEPSAAAHSPAPAASEAPLRSATPGLQLERGVQVASAGGAEAESGAQVAHPSPVGVEAPPRQTGVEAVAPEPSGAGAAIAALVAWARRCAATAVEGAVGVTLGLAALWPLWRRREGSGEIDVRGVCDAVAAVVGR